MALLPARPNIPLDARPGESGGIEVPVSTAGAEYRLKVFIDPVSGFDAKEVIIGDIELGSANDDVSFFYCGNGDQDEINIFDETEDGVVQFSGTGKGESWKFDERAISGDRPILSSCEKISRPLYEAFGDNETRAKGNIYKWAGRILEDTVKVNFDKNSTVQVQTDNLPIAKKMSILKDDKQADLTQGKRAEEKQMLSGLFQSVSEPIVKNSINGLLESNLLVPMDRYSIGLVRADSRSAKVDDKERYYGIQTSQCVDADPKFLTSIKPNLGGNDLVAVYTRNCVGQLPQKVVYYLDHINEPSMFLVNNDSITIYDETNDPVSVDFSCVTGEGANCKNLVKIEDLGDKIKLSAPIKNNPDFSVNILKKEGITFNFEAEDVPEMDETASTRFAGITKMTLKAASMKDLPNSVTFKINAFDGGSTSFVEWAVGQEPNAEDAKVDSGKGEGGTIPSMPQGFVMQGCSLAVTNVSSGGVWMLLGLLGFTSVLWWTTRWWMAGRVKCRVKIEKK